MQARALLIGLASVPQMTTSSSDGADRQIRTSLHQDSPTAPYQARRPRHLVIAALRLALKRGLLERLHFWLKWFVAEARTAANFWRQRTRLKRSIARSRRWKGNCESSALLFNHRPVSRRASTPISFNAAPWDRSLLVTITSAWACLRIAFFRKFNAALLSRVFVTKLLRASPS